MTKCYRRPVEVDAWRYDIDFSDRPDWLVYGLRAGEMRFDGLGALAVKRPRGGDLLVKQGEWLVRDPDGSFSCFDPRSFETAFVKQRPSYSGDVGAFHSKFGLPTEATQRPRMLDLDLLKFRSGFLLEELAEFFDANGMIGPAATLRSAAESIKGSRADILIPGSPSLSKAADALADLVYVALGTAHFMGVPFDEVWNEVQRANMAKERATGADDPRSKRAHSLDVVKPAGWTAPNHEPAIRAALARFERPTTGMDSGIDLP
jgi:predicted HAD superfamily Cof-like phosphohydrolase